MLGLVISNGPKAFNGIYQKLSVHKNGHYQWTAWISGAKTSIYFVAKTQKNWIISSSSGTLVLTGLDHFIEPVTTLRTVFFHGVYYDIRVTCHDVSTNGLK